MAPNDALRQLAEMGFEERAASSALRRYDNNVERAIDYLFAHMSGVEKDIEETKSGVEGWEMDLRSSPVKESLDPFNENHASLEPTVRSDGTVPSALQHDTQETFETTRQASHISNDTHEASGKRALPTSAPEPIPVLDEDEQLSRAVEESMMSSSTLVMPLDDDQNDLHVRRLAGQRPMLKSRHYPSIIPALYVLLSNRLWCQTILQPRIEHLLPKKPWLDYNLDNLWQSRRNTKQSLQHLAGLRTDKRLDHYFMLFELQRLVVFWHFSDRAVGWIDAFVDTLDSDLKNLIRTKMNKPALAVLEMVKAIADAVVLTLTESRTARLVDDSSAPRMAEDLHHVLFSGGHGASFEANQLDAQDVFPDIDYAASIDLSVTSTTQRSLYDLLDGATLPKVSALSSSNDEGVLIDRLAQVLIITIAQSDVKVKDDAGHKEPLQIENAIYLDRYLSKHHRDIIEKRVLSARCKSERLALEETLSSLKCFKGKYDVLAVMQDSSVYLESVLQDEALGLERRRVISSALRVVQERRAKVQGQIAESEARITSVDLEVQNLWAPEEFRESKYRLEGLMVHDGLMGPQHYWATMYNAARGSWEKTNGVETTACTVEQALNDRAGLHMSAGVYGAVYVDAAIGETVITLPDPWKEAIERDAMILDNPSLAEYNEHIDLTFVANSDGLVDRTDQDPEPVDILLDAKDEPEQPLLDTAIIENAVVTGAQPLRQASDLRQINDDEQSTPLNLRGGAVVDESSDDDEDVPNEGIILGFLEDLTTEDLSSTISKVGGRPLWLDSDDPLHASLVLCASCQRPMPLLLQLYAPDAALHHAQHRTLYVFCCPEGSCHQKAQNAALKVFRIQRSSLDSTNHIHGLDWPASAFSEKLIDHGQEPLPPQHGAEKPLPVSTLMDSEGDEMLMAEEESQTDKAFLGYQKRIQWEPEQVLRYARTDLELTSEPLWASEHGRPSSDDISPCQQCGAPREFEFQILSTLLNHLGVDHARSDSLDWGTILIYTCPKACLVIGASGKQCWLEETVHVQNFSATDLLS